MSQAPEVSVIIPVYNAMPYLERTLESVLDQTLCRIEVICVDDGSTDNSLQILKKIQESDERVIVLSQPNAGVSTARNRAIELANAKFIATLDADDYCPRHRLETQVAFLETHPDCVAVSGFAELVDENEESIAVIATPTSHADLDARAFQVGECAMCHAATMFRTTALRDLGGYRDKYTYVEDYDLFFRLAEIGQLACIPDVLYYYRQLPQSICRTKKQEQRRLVVECIRETCERRGIDFDEKTSPPELIPYEISTSRHYVNVAVQSILGGNPKTARANAFTALQHQPWHPFPWAAYALSFMPSSVTRSLVRNVIGRDV
ncbi:glycosyltransferase family 2 protein [Bremerella sp. P1]|uniref:glycosyltransferase family 2 protein n=1 Tax=Bremerella sp. P1 TaxID=3026424 RepID=UPI002368D6B7|nr:glycosyltransferase [Bremerella sp. P1]WDI43869.1 glycosyltransferase [Bremerella sp. P1]